MKITELKETLQELQRKYAHNHSLLAFVNNAKRIANDVISPAASPALMRQENEEENVAACESTAGNNLTVPPAGQLLSDHVAIVMRSDNLPVTLSSQAKGKIAVEIDSFLEHTDNFFLRHYCAQSRSELVDLKERILQGEGAKTVYTQQSDEQFFNELVTNLTRSLVMYSQNFHLVPIAPDRFNEAQDLLDKIVRIKDEKSKNNKNHYAKKIARVLKVLLLADQSIKAADLKHKHRNVFTKSRLQGIVARFASEINSYNKSDATKLATAKLREDYAARQLFTELKDDLQSFERSFHSKNRKQQAKKIAGVIENITTPYNNETAQSKEKTLLGTLHSTKVQMLREDQDKWFFTSKGSALRTIVEGAINDILTRTKTNPILAAEIKGILESFIRDLQAEGAANPKLAKAYALMIAQYQAVLDAPQPIIPDDAKTFMVSPSITPASSPYRDRSERTSANNLNTNFNNSSPVNTTTPVAPKVPRRSQRVSASKKQSNIGSSTKNNVTSVKAHKENIPNHAKSPRQEKIKELQQRAAEVFKCLEDISLSPILKG